VQFGIAAEPSETSKWSSASLVDDPHVQSNTQGTITYATSGTNTRTTQIFINLKDNVFLDNMGFTPFARVTSGLHLLQTMYNPTPGDSGGISQANVENKGNAWLLKAYPETEIIESTTLVLVPVNDDSSLDSSTNKDDASKVGDDDDDDYDKDGDGDDSSKNNPTNDEDGSADSSGTGGKDDDSPSSSAGDHATKNGKDDPGHDSSSNNDSSDNKQEDKQHASANEQKSQQDYETSAAANQEEVEVAYRTGWIAFAVLVELGFLLILGIFR
jgi:cyclophilin family peptidyl-prolyl cis-trans isomerase